SPPSRCCRRRSPGAPTPFCVGPRRSGSTSSARYAPVVGGTRAIALACALSALCTLSGLGCETTSGRLLEDAGAHVFLSEGNYRVLRSHVVGQSSGWFLLMFIPIQAPSYSEAKANLYQSLGEPTVGRSIALTNQTEDLTEVSWLIYSTRTITLTADFIEFNDPNGNRPLRPLCGRP